jgi:hypothetical protein
MEIGMFVPLLMVPLFVGWAIWNKMRLKRSMGEHEDKTVRSVAERMGLSVVEGDPQLNLLYFMQPSGDYERTIRLEGRPYGRPVRLWVSDGKKTSEYVVARTITRSYGGRLTVEVPTAPVFEVLLRNPNQYLVVEPEYADRPLQEVSTGDAMLDAHFIVRAEHPAIGPMLVHALSLLSTHLYVHLAGGNGTLWMRLERMGLSYVASAPAEYLLALETAACGVEGKPAPASIPMQPATPGAATA